MDIRPARVDDYEAVSGFTTGTFEWGDYVPDRFLGWLDEEDSQVLVATVDDQPIGLARVVKMSDREGWVHAARVHPDHRRTGVATALNSASMTWLAERGVVVVRLLSESWNEAARAQVSSIGYRAAGEWSWPTRELGSGRIDPVTNGGRRVPGEEQLNAGSRAEIDPAWIAWSSSEMAKAGRRLFPIGWTFRRMTLDDVRKASADRALLQCASGWVIARDHGDHLEVPWVVTSPLDAQKLARAVVDLAARRNAATVRVMVPSLPWLDEAFELAGCGISTGTIFEREVP